MIINEIPRIMKNITLVFSLLLLAGCASPTKHSVQRAFLQEHPGCTIVGVTKKVDGHDIPYADFTITYRKPSDPVEHEDVWHYFRLRHATEKPDLKETVK